LIFSHPDYPEAGLQVPAGTLEPGEHPEAGVLREAYEETGLTGFAAGFIDRRFDMSAWEAILLSGATFHLELRRR
jgi:8-oxo-dGTP pyrophosphatase MutT (NUDIX family)